MLWCDLALTFDFAVVTFTFKILSGLWCCKLFLRLWGMGISDAIFTVTVHTIHCNGTYNLTATFHVKTFYIPFPYYRRSVEKDST